MLDAMGESVELALVGGAALMLSGAHVRPTEDVDVVALRDGAWRTSSPLPSVVRALVRDVGRAYDLPLQQTGWANDWLNASASFLMPDDLPPGFFDRTTALRFSALVVHVPHRADLVTLKVLAATRTGRGDSRRRDVQDLVRLAPRADELAQALRWSAARRPTDDPGPATALLDELAEAGVTEALTARALLTDPRP